MCTDTKGRIAEAVEQMLQTRPVCKIKEDEKAHDDELPEVGFGVAEEAAQDLAVSHAALEAHSRFLVFDAGVGDEQQHRHGADDAAYEKKRIQTHHALPPPTSSSSFCKSTILWYSGQDA